MILGLTGGIACGKTAVAKIFEKYGIEILDADKIAHGLLESDEIKNRIKLAFGDSFFIDGEIDRKKLREIVFGDREKVLKLNSIVHPKIIEIFKERFYKEKNSKKIVVFDIPLLYEVELEKFCNKVLVVYLDKKTQIKRVQERDHSSEELAQKIIDSQMNLEEKIKKADYLIENNGTLKELEIKVVNLIKNL